MVSQVGLEGSRGHSVPILWGDRESQVQVPGTYNVRRQALSSGLAFALVLPFGVGGK